MIESFKIVYKTLNVTHIKYITFNLFLIFLSIRFIPSLTLNNLQKFLKSRCSSRRCYFYTFSRKLIVTTIHENLTFSDTKKRISFIKRPILSFYFMCFKKFKTYKSSRFVIEHINSLSRITISILSMNQQFYKLFIFSKRNKDRMLYLSSKKYAIFDNFKVIFSFISIMIDTLTISSSRISNIFISFTMKTFISNS